MEQIMVTTVDGRQVPLEADWGAQANREAERHLEACWEAHWAQEEAEGDVEIDSPAVGVFCGGQNCVHTCEVAEVLAAAMPFIEAGLRVRGDGPLPSLGVGILG